MRAVLFTALLAAACQRAPAPQTKPPPATPTAAPAGPPAAADAPPKVAPGAATTVAARQAYDDKQWARCAELFAALANAGGRRRQSHYYNAACCYALGGDRDRAFTMLDRSVASGMRDDVHLERDTDLASLHGDPRWSKVVVAVKAAREAEETKIAEPELRRELLALVKEDQAARHALIAAPTASDPTLVERVNAVDRKSTARMKEIVAKHGWPGKRLVGTEGANAAWLLVQHADLDREFQKLCLPLVEKAVAAGDAEPDHYAYLYDRIAVAEERPQRFGTQYRDGRPAPIEDETRVDERRKQVGLGTMAEYDQHMRERYGDKLGTKLEPKPGEKPDKKPGANSDKKPGAK